MDIAFIEYCFNLSLDPSSFQNLPITQTQPDSQQILWEYSLISNALERLENIELERQNCMREDGLVKYTNELLLNKETLNNEALKLYSCAKAGICRWVRIKSTNRRQSLFFYSSFNISLLTDDV